MIIVACVVVCFHLYFEFFISTNCACFLEFFFFIWTARTPDLTPTWILKQFCKYMNFFSCIYIYKRDVFVWIGNKIQMKVLWRIFKICRTSESGRIFITQPNVS